MQEVKDVAKLFLRIGFTAFGGPAAHIAMMRQEVVERRQWLTDNEFIDLVGATNLIPGPNSTELAIHIGKERAGWRGLVVAGLCFVVPAVVITYFLAFFYKEYGQLPEVKPFLYGITPAIIAIILAAIVPLAKKSIKTTFLAVVAFVVLTLAIFEVNEILLLFGAGFSALAIAHFKNRRLQFLLPIFPVAAEIQVSHLKLFLIFLKVGAILYGSGYVLFAFLDAELVETGLLSRRELVDAIAVGQFTPGPVFSSVTFIGYQMSGWQGAVISTVAIFLPAFVFVALLNPIVKKIRNSEVFGAFLDAVNVASVAVIVAVCYKMAQEVITDWRSAVIATASLIVVFLFPKINSALVVLAGSVAGYLLFLI